MALSIIEIASEEAASRNYAQVFAVHLRFGALSGVVREALESAFALAREHSALPQARLIIEEVPVRIMCPTCGVARPVESIQQMCCRDCGTFSAEVISGRELEVTQLEVSE